MVRKESKLQENAWKRKKSNDSGSNSGRKLLAWASFHASARLSASRTERAVCDESSQRNFDRVSFSVSKGLCCVCNAVAAITRTLNAKMFFGARQRKRKRRRLKIRTRVRKNIRRYIVFLSFVPSRSRRVNVGKYRKVGFHPISATLFRRSRTANVTRLDKKKKANFKREPRGIFKSSLTYEFRFVNSRQPLSVAGLP